MRSTRSTTFLLLAILLLSFTSALAQNNNREKVAVLDLQLSGGIPEEYSLIFSDILRQQLHETGRFSVFERNRMEEILREQGFQLSGCTSSECAVEVGQLLGVERMVAGSIGKVGTMYFIVIRLIDVESGEIVETYNVPCSCTIEQVATSGIPDAARSLAGDSYSGELEVKDYSTESPKQKKILPGAREHEKFQFGFTLGPGGAATESSLMKITSNGASLAIGMHFGYVIKSRLVVSFSVVAHQITNPRFEFLDATSFTTDSTYITLNGYGLGLKYYPWSSGYYLYAGLFQTQMSINFESQDVPAGETDYGGGIQVAIGKEWWIASTMAVGVEGYYYVSSAPDKPPYAGVTWDCWSTGVMLTFIYD